MKKKIKKKQNENLNLLTLYNWFYNKIFIIFYFKENYNK